MQTTPIPFDDDRAYGEGWGLFDVSKTFTPKYALCREDDATPFADDLEARAFVLNSAMDGSQYHRDALAILLGLHTIAKPAIDRAAFTIRLALAAAQARLDAAGLNVRARTEIMGTKFPVHCYGDDTAENADKHEAVRAEWRERVARHPGAYVVYDPNGDAEAWMLVGDDLDAIVKESLDHHDEIRAIG